MNCIIYTRFSDRPNAAECHSCEVQRAICEQFADQKGWHVREVYSDEAISGASKIEDRNLHAAIYSLKKGEVLLAYRRDRLARDLIIGLQIERVVAERGASVAVVSGDVYGNDPAATMMKQILMVVAEYERKMISERVSAAMRHYQKEGRRMSRSCPFGWRQDPQDPRHMVRDEVQQGIIADIVSTRDGGATYAAIAERLNATAADAKGGTVWTPTDVMRIYKRERPAK